MGQQPNTFHAATCPVCSGVNFTWQSSVEEHIFRPSCSNFADYVVPANADMPAIEVPFLPMLRRSAGEKQSFIDAAALAGAPRPPCGFGSDCAWLHRRN